MTSVPEPTGWDSWQKEPFASYRLRWPATFAHVPDQVIEHWVYRHWNDFQAWLPLRPMSWTYRLADLNNDQLLGIGHVRDWMRTLDAWGNDLFDGASRRKTWLGHFMLENGTTPAPMIVAIDARGWKHPRESQADMIVPMQLIEGHMRLAYMRALIRRNHPNLKQNHIVVLATLPPDV